MTSHAHAQTAASLIRRGKARLERGLWFYTPCLGWKEFVPAYVGPFRDGTVPCATENHVIPAFLEAAFNRPALKDELKLN